MADAEELDAEAADLEGSVRLDDVQASVAQQAKLSELDGDEAVGEPGGVHRDVQLGQNVRERSDVVLMAMGYQDGPDALPVLDEVRYVGDGEIDPGHILLREEHPGVDDDNVLAVLQGHHVLADFA